MGGARSKEGVVAKELIATALSGSRAAQVSAGSKFVEPHGKTARDRATSRLYSELLFAQLNITVRMGAF